MNPLAGGAERACETLFTIHAGEYLVALEVERRFPRALEYRVEQHVAKLGERLAALNLGTTIDTTGVASQPDRVSDDAVTSRA